MRRIKRRALALGLITAVAIILAVITHDSQDNTVQYQDSPGDTVSAAPAVPGPPASANTMPSAVPASTFTPDAPPPTASCHPLSSAGHCYRPGEFCPKADHGLAGTDAAGAVITCEDNDGWRWE